MYGKENSAVELPFSDTESQCTWRRLLRPNVLIVYLCLFWLLAACHFCFSDLSVREWLTRTEHHRLLMTTLNTQNSPGVWHCTSLYMHVQKRACLASYLHKCLFEKKKPIYTQNRPTCFVYIPAIMCMQSGIWRVSVHPWWASLCQMDGLSQCQRGDSWLVWPFRAVDLDPVLWRLLTAPDGWRVSLPQPTVQLAHDLASWKAPL